MVARLLCLLIFIWSGSSFAWGSATLIPYLSQQLTLMREGIAVSNKTLREIKSLQRGINDPVGEFDRTMRMEDEQYRDLSNIYREGRRTVKSGKRTVEDWDDYFNIESNDVHYQRVINEKPKIDREREVIYSADNAQQKNQKVRQNYEEISINLNQSSEKARSGAQASKINAKAQSYLLRQGNDNLALQEQQISILQTQLANQKAKDENRKNTRKVEYLKLIDAFRNMEPVE